MTPSLEKVEQVVARRWEIIAERNTILSAYLREGNLDARARLTAEFVALEHEAEMLLASISTIH